MIEQHLKGGACIVVLQLNLLRKGDLHQQGQGGQQGVHEVLL
jgi:hypothetical protein